MLLPNPLSEDVVDVSHLTLGWNQVVQVFGFKELLKDVEVFHELLSD